MIITISKIKEHSILISITLLLKYFIMPKLKGTLLRTKNKGNNDKKIDFLLFYFIPLLCFMCHAKYWLSSDTHDYISNWKEKC